MSPIIEGGDIIAPLGDRVLGRVLASDVVDQDNSIIAEAGTMINEKMVEILETRGVDQVYVRSPITVKPDLEFAVCAMEEIWLAVIWQMWEKQLV